MPGFGLQGEVPRLLSPSATLFSALHARWQRAGVPFRSGYVIPANASLGFQVGISEPPSCGSIRIPCNRGVALAWATPVTGASYGDLASGTARLTKVSFAWENGKYLSVPNMLPATTLNGTRKPWTSRKSESR